MQEYEVSVTVSNSRERTITFVLEPWGEIYAMGPHTNFTLLLHSPMQGVVEIDDSETSITVYAWEGCTASLFHNGKEVNVGVRPRVPKTPKYRT
ncbi:MAG TPA: hypothetical protein VFA09_02390 [Ktedonobacteraceae bacterium]|nr:hypothetical protein [Ktedonobacteraceae bacterium]